MRRSAPTNSSFCGVNSGKLHQLGRVILATFAWSYLTPTSHGQDPAAPSTPAEYRNEQDRKRAALAELGQEVRKEPIKAPDLETHALGIEGQHTISFAGKSVRTALRALGPAVYNHVLVARTICAAIGARPEATLQIVREAVQEAPAQVHPDIVGAATSCVPDPFNTVCVTRTREAQAATAEPTPDEERNLNRDQERYPTPAEPRPEEEVWAYQPCNGPTLAEAILQSAIEAGSTASQYALSNSVDTALESNLRPPTVTGDPGAPDTYITKWPTPPPVVSP
jgi:hypothetical protein